MRMRLKKLLVVFMAVCIAFTGMNPLFMQPASAADTGDADEPINHAVDISFTPQDLGSTEDNKVDIETGTEGAFALSVSVSHANDQTKDVTFKVKIRDKDVQLTDFDSEGKYQVPGRLYQLETDENGNRYITGSARPGDTFTQSFSFLYPKAHS